MSDPNGVAPVNYSLPQLLARPWSDISVPIVNLFGFFPAWEGLSSDFSERLRSGVSDPNPPFYHTPNPLEDINSRGCIFLMS